MKKFSNKTSVIIKWFVNTRDEFCEIHNCEIHWLYDSMTSCDIQPEHKLIIQYQEQKACEAHTVCIWQLKHFLVHNNCNFIEFNTGRTADSIVSHRRTFPGVFYKAQGVTVAQINGSVWLVDLWLRDLQMMWWYWCPRVKPV